MDILCLRLDAEAKPAELGSVLQAQLLNDALAALRSFSPLIEVIEPCWLLADVSGADMLYGGRDALAQTLLSEACAVAPIQVGLAQHRFTAQIAARTAGSNACVIVPPGGDAEFLAPLNIADAPIDPDLRQRLRLLGLDRLGNIAALPRSAFAAQFGQRGGWLWDAARGCDPTPLQPLPLEQPLGGALDVDPPLAARAAIEYGVQQLLAQLVRCAEPDSRAIGGLRLRIIYDNDVRWERRYLYREPSLDPPALWRTLQAWLARAQWTRPVARIELVVDRRGAAAQQESLFGMRGRTRLRLRHISRELESRYGKTPLKRLVEVEPWHRIPERRYALMDYEP